MNQPDGRATFHLMRPGRLFRLLLLALPIAFGLAAGAGEARPVAAEAVSAIGSPRQSLPVPAHDEATCAFCQAAVFPPCASQPTHMSVDELAPVRRECPAANAVTPRFTNHRPTSSRAPPTLRAV